MLLGTLGDALGNILEGKGMNRAREGFLRAGYESSIKKRIVNTASSLNWFWNTKAFTKWV